MSQYLHSALFFHYHYFSILDLPKLLARIYNRSRVLVITDSVAYWLCRGRGGGDKNGLKHASFSLIHAVSFTRL